MTAGPARPIHDCSISLLLLALGAAACQTSTGAPADAAAAPPAGADATVCPAATEAVDPTLLIDDFEGGSSLLPMIGGRVGGWYADGDGTLGAFLKPSGPVAPEPITGGRCGSLHALHVTGSGFLDWGAQVITPLGYGANDAGAQSFLPYDGSRYQGVRFFARVGDTSSTAVRFGVGDDNSRPEAGRCVVGGGITDGCYDTFGVDLGRSIGTDWREVRVPFAGLGARNIGLHGAALDTAMIYDLEFGFAANAPFDFWLDDISFY